MTAPMDDTLTAFARQLSIAYLPAVRQPVPRELTDLVVQLVAFELRKRGSSARPLEDLQFAMARPAPDPSYTDPSMKQ
jgi:hypothetical protein